MDRSDRVFWRVAAVSLAGLLAWDLAGLDMPLAAAMGGPRGFALRDAWVTSRLLHEGGRIAAWLVGLASCLAVAWPRGPWRRLPFGRRVQLALAPLLAAGVVAVLKAASHTSCPWDLADFGGVARHLSHWQGWLQGDGGAGRCFPAGHAGAGFAFAAGYFAWRADAPRLAWVWLATAVAAGFVLGWAQQLRGAHFMSHTLWTGWLCWMVGGALDAAMARMPWLRRGLAP